MTKQPGLILYMEDLAALEMLSESQFKAFICGLYHYAREGVVPSFADVTLDALFVLFRAKIDRDAARYGRQIEQRREAAARRWGYRPDAAASDRNQTEKASKTEDLSENSLSYGEFGRPTLEEVAAEAKRAGLQVDAAQFLADCEADRWKDSQGEPVRDWRKWLRGYAAMRRANIQPRGEKAKPTALQYDQRAYTEKDFEDMRERMLENLRSYEGGEEA